jgi:hypothetical protein
MNARSAMVAAALLLAGCASERPPPPYFVIPTGSAAPGAPATPAIEVAPRPVSPSANPEVQRFLPAHPEDVARGPAEVPRPGGATTPFYAAPPNLGPVTGYGPGGMAQPPGAPPNPPYPPGGLMRTP